jgi:hypothetical protein
MYVRKNERFSFSQTAPNISGDMLDGLRQGKYSLFFVGVLGPYYSYCYFVTGDMSEARQCSPEGPALGFGGKPLGTP